MSDEIRKNMFLEMEQKKILDEARDAAYRYADAELERNVFATPEAIEDLASPGREARR